ncbi:MAG: hypothetical protein IT196_10330 [Acidimicrobiales bacterium]|nr:hypothetical protein [Acidimicrobiales bacterium]
MPRRIDVELTSRRDDGTWTWRAAGAREPKGSVDSTLLPGDAAVGMVLKAEVEIDIEGIIVTAITPPKSVRSEPQRLEIIGGRRNDDQLVTTSLVRRGRDDRRPRRDRGDRPDRGDGPGGDRAGRPRGDRPDRGPRPDGDRRRPFERRPPLEPKPKAKRLRAGRAHRSALIAELPEEHRPIAEELIRGGVPAVRAALDKQNEAAKAEGRPEIDPTELVALAEKLWPQVRAAEWRDRAEGALADVDELDLRDLRSVVVAADGSARDDEARALAGQLRDALNRRVDEEHAKWLAELQELVADGRVVGALRRSSRPPKAGAPLPAELAAALAQQTGEALTAEVTADRWAVVLDALSFSPVRTSVTPASVPEERSEELLAAVRKSASRLPAIAALFGIEAEAAPAPGRGPRRARPAGRPGGAPIPPKPPLPPKPAPMPSEADADAAPGAADSPAAEAPVSEEPIDAAATAETEASSDAPVADEPAQAEAPAAEASPQAEAPDEAEPAHADEPAPAVEPDAPAGS